MNILFYHPFFNSNDWIPLIQQQLPEAIVYPYCAGQNPPADYALIWKPNHEMLAHRHDLKAIFALGAGVDAILDQLQQTPDLLPKNVPLYRLEDAGMALQMQEYTIAIVMRYFRRLDEYYQQQIMQQWRFLPPHQYDQFIIGVMGLGVLGAQVAKRLASLGFKVKGWSYSLKSIAGIDCYHHDQLDIFLSGTKLLINLLPSTQETQGILNKQLFCKLADDSYLINIARGKHLVKADLLSAISSNKIKAATLDVFAQEPLPKDDSFWDNKAITITPHISALTKAEIAVPQIIEKIHRIERGEKVVEGLIDFNKGY
ncbi:glyoxylate/hydroxypyruvate reductase A [Orbus sturtevantii]|uniref:2-hydroxyacid dehydrogenase n=1 Tax=Orbus sturtevantii TaxID=3074109 RepID=UPI00370D15FD